MTLTEFVEARLADDETTAKCAQMWQQEHHHAVFIAHYGSEWGAIDDYDPARVLRDVEAKRRTLALHHLETESYLDGDGIERPGHHCWECDQREWPCPTVRAVASVWSRHLDYDLGWA